MPLRLFAIPDQEAETNHYEIAVPKIGSYVLTHEFGGVVPGLKDVPPDQRPPVLPVFFVFRGMVAIGFAMLGVSLWSLYLRWKGTLFANRLFLYAAMLMTPSGFGAVLLGWFTAEIGRQPYVVYGHLRTADAVSPVASGAVTASLATFVVVYLLVFGFGSYYLAKILRKGPDPVDDDIDMRPDDVAKKPKRPFSLPDEHLGGHHPGRGGAPVPAE
jgi:cytochrome d ubiquinol oxidase subunit I